MFDSVTAGSHSLPKDFRVIGPAAAALHLVVIGGLVVASWWRVGEIALPELSDPMPPLRVVVENQGSGGEVRHRAPSPNLPRGVRKAGTLLEPALIPEKILVKDDLGPEAPDPNASRSGDAGHQGDPLGDPDGRSRGAGGPGTGPGGGDGPFVPGGDVTAPLLLHRAEPLYPETARKLRREGVVTLEAIITAAGSVEELRIVGSADSLLDDAAVHAVRQWRYRPGSLNGRPVPVILTVRVSFKLH